MKKCQHCGATDFRYESEYVGNKPENENKSYLVWICNKSQIETLEGKYDK